MFKPKSTLAEANKAGVGLNVVVSGKNANSARNIAIITESYGLNNDEMQKVINNLFSSISKDQTESIQKLILIRLLMSGRIVFKEKSSFLPFMFSVIGKQYRPKFTSLKDQTEFNRETEDMLKNLNNDKKSNDTESNHTELNDNKLNNNNEITNFIKKYYIFVYI